MSSENEDQALLKSPDESKPEHRKKSKLSYTRDFLLSLSELDACKKLPPGFDASILGDFGDSSGSSAFDRQRNLGSLSLPGSKRSEYGSILPNRSESSSSYARGNQGRWDTRSSGSSDKEGDLQPDRESVVQDSGRRVGSQSRRHWQNSEHDGLLGSGAFPRPTGYAASTVPKARGDGHYQLNRSTEPYQPPRPYKAMPYSRKDGTDSYNDETFGFTECSSEDRAEEERKRRESFETMRKEQHKTLQEKHKQNFDNHKENLDVDIIALLGNSADAKNMGVNKLDEPSVSSLSQSDPSRSSVHIQASTSRPLVPPGFKSTLVDKNVTIQSPNTSLASEVRSSIGDSDFNKHSLGGMENKKDTENAMAAWIPVGTEKIAARVPSQLSIDANEKPTVPILSAEILKQNVDSEKLSGKTTVQGTNEVWEDDIVIMNDSSFKKGSASEIATAVSQDQSTTILEKLFSSALSKNFATSPKSIQHQDIMVDEGKLNHEMFESSKFARWFSEEEKKSEEDSSSRDLLSLIVSSEKSGSQLPTSIDKGSQHTTQLAFESVVTESKLPISPAPSSVIRLPEQYPQGDKKASSSVVLTCEDLEQSILAEVKDNSPIPSHSIRGDWTLSDGKSDKQKSDVDDQASQHLLSLLQKGMSLKESVSSPGRDILESTDSRVNPRFNHMSDGMNSEMVHTFEQKLTLEALFGASFMNALHSAEAPVSAQRSSAATVNNNDVMELHGVPFPPSDEGFLSATSHESRSNKAITEGDMRMLKRTQKDQDVPALWECGYDDASVNAAKHGETNIGERAAADIQLPEEDSLITVSDTVNSMTIDPFSLENARRPEELLPENINSEDFSDNFFNSIFRDAERLRTRVSDSPIQLQKAPSEMVDHNDLFHQLQGRPSSHFNHQMDQTRPLFVPVDPLAHRSPHMKFASSDGMHHNPRRSFPGNLVPPQHTFSNMGASRFDPPAAHHALLQHMPYPGNFPLHHPMQNLQRGVPPSHPINHMQGYMPEVKDMHNFPPHIRQPNYGGSLGMGLPGPVVGGGGAPHPEALERLIEMEMRANSKQIHPPLGVQIPGIFGPENMNFRYR